MAAPLLALAPVVCPVEALRGLGEGGEAAEAAVGALRAAVEAVEATAAAGDSGAAGGAAGTSLPSTELSTLHKLLRDVFAAAVLVKPPSKAVKLVRAGSKDGAAKQEGAPPEGAVSISVSAAVQACKAAGIAGGTAAASAAADVMWLLSAEVLRLEAQRAAQRSAAGASTGSAHGDEWARLAALVGGAAEEGVAPKHLLKQRLDADLLEAAGVVPTARGWVQREIKANTRMRYTQKKFNLLREESEGYAKLLTELVQPLHEDMLPTVERNMRSLIGFFHLDPNRVLDLVLEAAEVVGADELRRRNGAPGEPPLQLRLLSLFAVDKVPNVLGFKFQGYHGGRKARTPSSLLHLAASLIANEKVSLDALLPHLAPDAESLRAQAAARSKALKQMARGFTVVSLSADTSSKDVPGGVVAPDVPGSGNVAVTPRPGAGAIPATITSEVGTAAIEAALAPAGGGQRARLAEGDDGEEGEEGEADEPVDNQQFGLLAALLRLHAWTPAMSLLKRLRAAGAQPLADREVVRAMCDLVHAMVWPAFEILQTRLREAQGLGPRDPPPHLRLPETREGVDAPKRVTRAAAVPSAVAPYLAVLGVRVADDPRLFAKLCQLLRAAWRADGTKEAAASDGAGGAGDGTSGKTAEREFVVSTLSDARLEIYNLVRDIILPALSLSGSSASASQTVWQLVSVMPWRQRYALYRAWAQKASSDDLVKLADARAAHAASAALKRLSKEFFAAAGRALAKSAHANPIRVMTTMLSQLETIDNLIPFAVSACARLTPLTLDVLTYCLVERFMLDRPKTKDAGQTLSKWLQAMSTFAASLFRAYSGIELGGVLRLIETSLADGSRAELEVLKSLVTTMGGVESVTDISAEQLNGQAGGKVLRAASALSETSDTKTDRRAAARLLETLTGARGRVAVDRDNRALPLLLLVGRQADDVLFASSDERPHIKVLSDQLDTVRAVFTQYSNYLQRSMPPADYAKLLPDASVLAAEYHLKPALFFHAIRPVVRDAESDKESAWHRESDALAAAVDKLATRPDWTSVTKRVYLWFWTHSLYDIFVPTAEYDAVISRKRAEISQIQRNALTMDSSAKRKCDKLQAQITQLKEERTTQEQHVRRVLRQLHDEKELLFDVENHKNTVMCVLQHFVLPRLVMSPEDALYCAKFVAALHEAGTPYFSTLMFYDKAHRVATPTLLSATPREALSLAVFLREILTNVARWRGDSRTFEKECAKLPGFAKKINDLKAGVFSFEEFQITSEKWQRKVAVVFKQCFESKDYVNVKNALTVCKELVSVFPTSRWVARALLNSVGIARDAPGVQEDVKTVAGGYYALLEKRERELPDDRKPSERRRDTAASGGAGGAPRADAGTKRRREPDSRDRERSHSRSRAREPSRSERRSSSKPSERRSSSRAADDRRGDGNGGDRRSDSRGGGGGGGDRRAEARERDESRRSESRGGDRSREQRSGGARGGAGGEKDGDDARDKGKDKDKEKRKEHASSSKSSSKAKDDDGDKSKDRHHKSDSRKEEPADKSKDRGDDSRPSKRRRDERSHDKSSRSGRDKGHSSRDKAQSSSGGARGAATSHKRSRDEASADDRADRGDRAASGGGAEASKAPSSSRGDKRHDDRSGARDEKHGDADRDGKRPRKEEGSFTRKEEGSFGAGGGSGSFRKKAHDGGGGGGRGGRRHYGGRRGRGPRR